tara:strand:+ start:426 stop:1226 length:801 start_codon:yes stop_codon:yes gene_type:complete
MAKVKIQGHASGTGVLTVTAPNTSTDRTITLPDATSTIATTTDVAARLPSITDNGNATAITIGTDEKVTLSSTDSENLFIDGGHSTNASIKIKGAYHSNLYAKLTESAGQFIISADDGNQETNSCLIFKVKGTERMRLTPDGITFNGDTAAANALDDFEYGTWTPQNSSGTAYSLNGVARYVKVGNLVTFACDINQLTSGYSVFGLPFNADSTSAGSVAFGYTSYGAGVMAYVTTPAKFNIHQLDGNSIGANNHRFILTGKYITTQ